MIMYLLNFNQWATEISQQSDGVYKEEMASRHDYSRYVGKSLLNNFYIFRQGKFLTCFAGLFYL